MRKVIATMAAMLLAVVGLSFPPLAYAASPIGGDAQRWYTAPMPVFTFLEQYDLKGKTVIPFCTAYSGPSQTLKDIVKATPDSDHRDGICIVTKEMGGTGMDKHHAKSDLRCSAIVGIS